jgi:ribosomal protein S18 acetylase RimI-like enzyme
LIAPLGRDAIPAAVALWQAAGLTRPWNDPIADAERALAGPSSTILAVHEGERLVGTVMVGHDGHRGWVYYLAVVDDCRRAGHGRALMAAAMDWLRAADVPRLNLMVRSDNAAALDFYAALGFRQSDVHVLQHDL